MPYYKDQNQQLHYLEDVAFEDLLPGGCTRVSDVEASTIQSIQSKPTEAEIIAGFVAQAQKRLDDFARTRNYDGILSACTYATSAVPKFAAEGQYAVEARDATWSRLYDLLAEVKGGQRSVPESFELDIAPELPVLIWPD